MTEVVCKTCNQQVPREFQGDVCPTCNQPIADKCEYQGCSKVAEYEGWWRATDPVFGKPTGLLQLRKACKEHAELMIGWNKKLGKG
jgi:predicted amidophosphoribosyltransferase